MMNSVKHISLLTLMNHLEQIKHRGPNLVRIFCFRSDGVPENVTKSIIGWQQILSRTNFKGLLRLICKSNLHLVKSQLGHTCILRMLIKIEPIWNDLRELAERS